jgi:Holliday junction resolvase
MGKINSIQKGKAGERELANLLKEKGYETRRGQQFAGNNGDADVVGLPHIHIECKRVENLNVYKAHAQATADSKGGTPTVFHRKNSMPWLVTMSLTDWLNLYELAYGKPKELDTEMLMAISRAIEGSEE